MVKINIKKNTLILLNLFLALSVIVNVVLIVNFHQSRLEFEDITSNYESRVAELQTGLAMSQNVLFLRYSPIPQSMCQSHEDCYSDLHLEKTTFYSKKIRTTPEIRSIAVQATFSSIPNYHMLCEKIKDENLQTQTGTTYCKEAVSIYYWVRDNIRYVTGPLGGCEITEVCQDSETTLELGAGKCDEQAVLLVSMLRSVGINSWIVLLNTDKTFNECLEVNCTVLSVDHSIVVARLSGLEQLDLDLDYWYLRNDPNMILLDPTCKTCEFGELPPLDKDKMVWVT